MEGKEGMREEEEGKEGMREEVREAGGRQEGGAGGEQCYSL